MENNINNILKAMGILYTPKPEYRKAFESLEEGLNARGLQYTLEPHADGYCLVVKNDDGTYAWDAACHSSSYGHEKGLLETYGVIVNEEEVGDTVEGWLTAEDVLARVDRWLAR